MSPEEKPRDQSGVNVTRREMKMVNSISSVAQLKQQVLIQGPESLKWILVRHADNFCSSSRLLGETQEAVPWPTASLYTSCMGTFEAVTKHTFLEHHLIAGRVGA